MAIKTTGGGGGWKSESPSQKCLALRGQHAAFVSVLQPKAKEDRKDTYLYLKAQQQEM